MINIGVIGLGVIAKYYLAALPTAEMVRLVAVCDLSDEKTRLYRNSEVSIYTNYMDLLQDPAIDAVIINLPNDLHFSTCRDALLQGKHVCCEKPLTLNTEQAQQLQQIARHAKRTLFTAFHRRYNQPLITLRAVLPALDAIECVDIYYREKIEEHAGDDTWYLDSQKCGGGCVADNGPNAFDTLCWLIGPLTVRRAQIMRDTRGIDIEAIIDLENACGLRARTWLDWAWPYGEDKRVVFTLKDGRVLSGDMLEGSVAFKSSLFHEYARVIDDFVRHISEARGLGEEGIAAVALVDSCYALERAEAAV